MANILRSLLTPFAFFEMFDAERWKEYKKEIVKDDPSPETMLRGTQSWSALTDTAVVEKRSTTVGIFTKDFMNALDKVLTKAEMEKVWFQDDEDDWKVYCDAVERLFSQYVYKRPFEQPDEREVRDQWRRKWNFIKMDHDEHHIQKPLLLLTPSSVETLALALGKVRQSVAEVSILYYTSSTCAVRHGRPAQSDIVDLRS